MSVHPLSATDAVLDVAVRVLIADPGAALAEVAATAGIGRTTLHKHFATRDDLTRAVGHRAVDRWQQAMDAVEERPSGERFRALVEALVPIGPFLEFLWRSPALDHDAEITTRWEAVEERVRVVLAAVRDDGTLRSDVRDHWLLQTLYALVYVASEGVRHGRVAPLDAPDLVLDTLVNGLGA